MTADRNFLEILKPLLGTRPMFGVFALGDGSGRWFCASCGRRSEPPSQDGTTQPIPHTDDCKERSHWVAIGTLKLAMQDAGVD